MCVMVVMQHDQYDLRMEGGVEVGDRLAADLIIEQADQWRQILFSYSKSICSSIHSD